MTSLAEQDHGPYSRSTFFLHSIFPFYSCMSFPSISKVYSASVAEAMWWVGGWFSEIIMRSLAFPMSLSSRPSVSKVVAF